MRNSTQPNRRNTLLRLSFGVTLLLSACSGHPDGPIDWKTLGIESLTLIRKEPAPFHEFRFHREGIVSATFLQPNGMAIAPALYWRLEGKTLIMSEAPTGATMLSFSNPNIENGLLVVEESGGARSRFKYRTFW